MGHRRLRMAAVTCRRASPTFGLCRPGRFAIALSYRRKKSERLNVPPNQTNLPIQHQPSMEKEHQPDSMATVQMKADYPPSEVYSTSEPPPAYRHPRPASVQIARLAAVTIIISSLLLGSFILAASYIHARAGCNQLDQLDAMLEKELALEARQMQSDSYGQEEPLPLNAQALHQSAPQDSKKPKVELNEEKLQSLGDSQSDSNDSDSESSAENSESNDSEENQSDVKEPIRITLPLQLDFDELAGALMEKNQRSRMNCVVEKRKAENLVDHQPRNVRLPFGLNLTTDPRLERVTGERMAIFCESGNENRQVPEAEILPSFPFPLPGPVSLPLNFPVNRFGMRPPMPAQHMQAPGPQPPHPYQMPQEFRQRPMMPFMGPPQMNQIHQMSPQGYQPHMPPQGYQPQMQPQMQSQMTLIPREVRIHVQRIQLPQVEPENVPQDSHMGQEDRQQEIQLQQLPIQMISEEELRTLDQVVRVAEQERAEQMRAEEQEAQEAREVHEASREMLGRQAMARALPIHIPVPMMQREDTPVQDPERPHYVQPRSVRSTRSVDSMLHRDKRVKRSCSCDCAC